MVKMTEKEQFICVYKDIADFIDDLDSIKHKLHILEFVS